MSKRIEYLSTQSHTPHLRHLAALAAKGFRFIVVCTDETQEPLPEGFSELDAAMDREAELRSDTGYMHKTFEIRRDADGDFWTDFQLADE